MRLAQAHIDGATDHYEVEHRMLHRDGSIWWFLAWGVVVARDGPRALRIIGTNTDITERKRAEAALRESEERFRTLADSAPMMVWATNAEGQPSPSDAYVAPTTTTRTIGIRA